MKTASVTKTVTAGWHNVRIEYFRKTPKKGGMIFKYSGPDTNDKLEIVKAVGMKNKAPTPAPTTKAPTPAPTLSWHQRQATEAARAMREHMQRLREQAQNIWRGWFG